MELIKVTKGMVKKVVVVKCLVNLKKEKETPIMNISGTPVITATLIRKENYCNWRFNSEVFTIR